MSRCRRCCCCPLRCDSTWKQLNTAGGPGPYHDLHLSCIYSQPFLLHCFFPSQEPRDTFLEKFSDVKDASKKVLPREPQSGTCVTGFKHNDEEQWAEYQALVNTDLHIILVTVPITNTDMVTRIGMHPLDQWHNPLLNTKFSQRPPDDLPRHSIKFYKSHVECLVGS